MPRLVGVLARENSTRGRTCSSIPFLLFLWGQVLPNTGAIGKNGMALFICKNFDHVLNIKPSDIVG